VHKDRYFRGAAAWKDICLDRERRKWRKGLLFSISNAHLRFENKGEVEEGFQAPLDEGGEREGEKKALLRPKCSKVTFFISQSTDDERYTFEIILIGWGGKDVGTAIVRRIKSDLYTKEKTTKAMSKPVKVGTVLQKRGKKRGKQKYYLFPVIKKQGGCRERSGFRMYNET